MKDTVELNAMYNEMVRPYIDSVKGSVLRTGHSQNMASLIKNFAWKYADVRTKRVRSAVRNDVFDAMSESFKDDIVRDVCKICDNIGVNPELVLAKTKGNADVVAARHLCVMMIVEKHGYDSRMMARVGRVMSGRDRTTIYHSYKTAKGLVSIKDPYFMTIIKEAENSISTFEQTTTR